MVSNRAGEFDQRIVLETRRLAIDELGAETETWLFEGECWARVIETPGREFLAGDFKAEEKAVFKIRWREIDSAARVIWPLSPADARRIWRIDGVTGTYRDGARWLHCVAQDEAN